MVEDVELWARAMATLSRFGNGAEIEVALQIVRSATRQDDAGVSTWRQIGRYLGKMRAVPTETELRH